MTFRNRRWIAPVWVAAIALSVTVTGAVAAGGGKGKGSNGAYIVQLAEMPVTAYRGDIAGYKATAPRKGQKIDPYSSDVVSYKAYLQARQDQTLASVGGGRKLYNYGYVFNGFAAELTADQAAKLATQPGVLSVSKDEIRRYDTASTPGFLGLAGPTGFWETYKTRGENVIIGIVDSGIWPEHPSVSDRTDVNGNGTQDGKLGYQQIPGWNGKCEPGEAFAGSNCNQKLIGARYYNSGYGGNAATKEQFPYEFLSPRDFDGHGTHTATTSGGNANVATTGPASVIGAISGMAPRARIAAYKVCWGNGIEGGCAISDSVAAIDQAVADGVDVNNFSISGTSTNFFDPVEVAFLFAADAGVFVAASAGNSGPTAATVAHPSPWLTTVAAGTHNRQLFGTVTLGNGTTYTGASASAVAIASTTTILASSAGATGATATAVRLCFSAADNGGTAALDPNKVAGKIVVCDRGTNPRTSKSDAVRAAGGIGMILVNTSPNSLNADFHAVPTVHLSNTDGAAVKVYVSGQTTATAALSKSVSDLNADAPLTASFSSRGPLLGAGGDLLKPDIIAPGQDILAGVAPPNYGGRLFDLLSGTSMSSPHIAGIAALMKEAHPTWSPMAIKSALMTSAYDVHDFGTPAPETSPTLIFRQGAGHVRPLSAFNPGLVYEHGFYDWLAFLCGTSGGVSAATCNTLKSRGYSSDPSNLNGASIAIGDMAGSQSVKRRLTNVSGKTLTVNASVNGPAGLSTVVSPATLTLAAGATKEFTVQFNRTDATLNAYTGGQLRWAGGGYEVRSPIVVRPVPLAASAAVSSTGAAISYAVAFGYSGAFTATARGLVAATVTPSTVSDDPTDSTCGLDSPNAVKFPVSIPSGTTYARFATFDADVSPGSDIDMCVFKGVTLVGSSGSGTSSETVSLTDLSGDYTVVVQGWGVVGSTPFKLHTWLVDGSAAGNMAVAAPSAAVSGTTANIGLSFSGLAAGVKYLGTVAYGGIANLPSATVVTVNP